MSVRGKTEIIYAAAAHGHRALIHYSVPTALALHYITIMLYNIISFYNFYYVIVITYHSSSSCTLLIAVYSRVPITICIYFCRGRRSVHKDYSIIRVRHY